MYTSVSFCHGHAVSRDDRRRRACHGDGCGGTNADGGSDDVIPRGWSEESPELATAVTAMENTTALDGTAGGGNKEEESTGGGNGKVCHWWQFSRAMSLPMGRRRGRVGHRRYRLQF